MDEKEHIELYVCVRTSDLEDAPGGLKANCADCGSEIWHKPEAPTHMKMICAYCIPPNIGDSNIVAVLPGSMAPRKYHS